MRTTQTDTTHNDTSRDDSPRDDSPRKLVLARETLRSLTSDELRLAAGGFRSCGCKL